MAMNSKIEWTDHTFNPWRGCTKVSAGCANCYAEAMSRRNPGVLGEWGPHGTRVVASHDYWQQPRRWDAEAQEAGVRRRVFCASLADVFEGPETMPAGVYRKIRNARARLFSLIRGTPHLDWLLLTKRPQNVVEQVREVYEDWPLHNVWLGTSVEDQEATSRISHLVGCPAAVRFLSVEPLLEGVELFRRGGLIDWVIVGGESGPGARPCNIEWVGGVVEECRAAGVPVFVKQLGSRPHIGGCIGDEMEWPEGTVFGTARGLESSEWHGRFVKLSDPKGGDMSEWPKRLQVRESR